jgi:hypothetical protein
MKVYQTDEIRNISLIGATGTLEKQPLQSQCFLKGGVIDRRGNVDK